MREKKVYQNKDVVKECCHVLMIQEISLTGPFSNTKLGRMFSQITRVKNDWGSRLNQRNFDALLQIGEEGLGIHYFGVNESNDYWFND